MSAEFYNRTQVAEFLGVGETTLIDWEDRGFLTPEKSVLGRQGEGVVYDRSRFERAALIRQLRDHEPPYTFEEISDVLRNPDWRQTNRDLIEAILGQQETD